MDKGNIEITVDGRGRKVAVIPDILFYGKKNIPWNKVETYLKKYIGDVIMVADTKEEIHIGKDFPDEFKGSEDTYRARGGNAKAKANSVQGIHEMIYISEKVSESENKKSKNRNKASQGWYWYLTRFALPVFSEQKQILHHNVYLATLIVRVDGNGILYLYDVIHVKKESILPI